MADNVAITAGAGTSIAADDISSVWYQRIKLVHGADGVNAGDVALTNPLPVSALGFPVMIQTDVILPTSTIYSAGDALSTSTSSPTVGGSTFTGAARVSGGAGIITDATVATSADQGTRLAGEIWLFDRAVTAINDNAVFAVSDAEIKTCVGVIPFSMFDAGNNHFSHITGLNILFTCNGSANLRFLIRCRNAYTPATDTLTFTLKILQLN